MRYPENESSTVEWKREYPRNDQILKTIIGFCNQDGGKLIIGVSNDGTVVGVPPAEVQKALEFLEKMVFDGSHPPIIPRVSSQRFGGKYLLIIEVSAGMSKPYYRKADGVDKGTYVRLGRSTLLATASMIEELRWQSVGLQFETLPCYKARKEDLDMGKIEHFLSHRKNHGAAPASDPMLRAYRLILMEHSIVYPTNVGLLLFGKEPQHFFSEAMIICTQFHGVSGREVMGSLDCEGGLFEQFQQAYSFVVKRLSKAFTIDGPQRKETLEIPEVAIREALLNAIVHRNYHIQAPTKVSIYEDRIEIFSPGGFPGPLDPANLRAGITHMRNPALCKVFREAGYVEKLGSGLIAIFEAYEARELETPQVLEGVNHVKCILPRTMKKKKRGRKQSVLEQLFALSSEISLIDVQKILGVSRATATRRMNELIEAGSVERIGKTKAIRFRRI